MTDCGTDSGVTSGMPARESFRYFAAVSIRVQFLRIALKSNPDEALSKKADSARNESQ